MYRPGGTAKEKNSIEIQNNFDRLVSWKIKIKYNVFPLVQKNYLISQNGVI